MEDIVEPTHTETELRADTDLHLAILQLTERVEALQQSIEDIETFGPREGYRGEERGVGRRHRRREHRPFRKGHGRHHCR